MRVIGGKSAGKFFEQDRESGDWFSAPIARELVHRRAVAEVFLTGIHPVEDLTYTVAAQWPRWHVFYGSNHDRFDSALVV